MPRGRPSGTIGPEFCFFWKKACWDQLTCVGPVTVMRGNRDPTLGCLGSGRPQHAHCEPSSAARGAFKGASRGGSLIFARKNECVLREFIDLFKKHGVLFHGVSCQI